MYSLKAAFENYISQLVVLGFNSSKYDIPVLKAHLVKQLDLNGQGSFVVKKGTAYACLAEERLKFLDIAHYLPAGVSLRNFLKTFRIKEQKLYFPYEWLTSYDKLQ